MGMFQKIKAYLNEDDAEYDALIEEQERMREERESAGISRGQNEIRKRRSGPRKKRC